MDPAEIAGLVGLVAVSFAATNTDNLILLVVLMGADPARRGFHKLGFLLASFAVMALAGCGLILGGLADPAWIGYMGFIPLALGSSLLIRQWRGAGAESAHAQHTARQGPAGGVLATALLMLGNSADSLAIFLPLAAESGHRALAWGAAAYLAMAAVWITAAGYLAGHQLLARRIEAVGEKLIPLVMIGAGIYILLDTASDTLR